jgi:UPF0755 protein
LRRFGIVVLVLLLAGAAGAGFVWYSLTKPYGTFPPQGLLVEIPHGAARRTAAHILKKKGVIRSAIAFEIYARRHPRRTLQAGQYMFDHPLTGTEVFWKLAKGEVFEQAFLVHEGDTIFDVAQNLESAQYMKATDFLVAAQDASQIQDIAPGAKTLEGFLYPATYNLPSHATPTDLTTMMVHKFREAMQQIAPDRLDPQIPGTPLLSIVTLASLVEGETPKPDERPIVAGVYTNRLHKGMLLQCDPTVIYALKQVNHYDHLLTLKDLQYSSPYNTYIHSGLPPGPIGNPGETAIRAALAPAQTDYLYFVANTQGGHFFAATLAEHNQNVAKYHRLLKGDSADPPGPEAHPIVARQASRKNRQSTRKGKR